MLKGYAVNQRRLEYIEKTIKLIDIANRIDERNEFKSLSVEEKLNSVIEDYNDINSEHCEEFKNNELIKIAEGYMKTIKDNEHNINHVKDVVNYTKELLNMVNIEVNQEACIIGAYWHDVGRIKLLYNKYYNK